MRRLIRSLEEKLNETGIEAASLYKAGQAVKLQHNALDNLHGLVQSVSGKRIAVLMEILGRPIVVQVERHQLEVI